PDLILLHAEQPRPFNRIGPDQQIEQNPRQGDGGQETDGDAENQRYCKAAHAGGSEIKEDHRRQNRGDVGVEDGEKGATRTGFYRNWNRLPEAHLLLDPLIHQNIGIHRHPDPQDEGGNPRQRQGYIQQDKGQQDKIRIGDQADGRDQSRQPIITDDEEKNGQGAVQTRLQALLEGQGAQTGIHGITLFLHEFDRQCSGVEQVGQLLRFLHREIAADDRLSAWNRLPDHRSTQLVFIQINGHDPAHVFPRDLGKLLGILQFQADRRLTRLVIILGRSPFLQVLTRQKHLAAFIPESQLRGGAENPPGFL